MDDRRPATNWWLASLIEEAGLSHGALARQVVLLGKPLDLRYNAASVNRWLRGSVPNDPVPALLAEVLSRRLGRQVDASVLFDAGESFLQLATTAPATVDTATALWRDAVRRRDVLAYPFLAAAGLEAAWRWCFTPAGAEVTGGGVRQVGMSDVERLLAARRDFAGLDRRHGGGHARAWLTDYLDQEATPLLRGAYRAGVGRPLFSAVAQLTEHGSYMAFDEGLHGLSQRMSVQALALAKHAGDLVFGAYVMSNVAAQHVWLGDGARAAQMARAAVTAAGTAASATLRARLWTTEARGHALAGDVRECRAALRRAERALERSDPSRDPEWLGASSPAHHAGSAMHCLRDLAQARDHDRRLYREAAGYTAAALDLPPDSTRARALHQVLVARVEAGLKEPGQSRATARKALHAVAGLRSRRVRERISQYGLDLAERCGPQVAAQWREEARSLQAA